VSSKRLLLTLTAGGVLAATFAPPASAALKAGDILVVDPDVPPVSTALLFQVDPDSGARTVVADFGAGNPTSVAAEQDGDVLVTDTAAGTDPSGGTNEWGALFRLTPDPATGTLTRTVLTDFGVGPSTGRNPRAVAVEADGRILVLNGNGGTAERALLVRVDQDTGARAVVSDFGSDAQGALGVEPRGVAVEADGRIVVIDAQAGTSGQGQLVRVDPRTGARTILSNFGSGANPGSNPTAVAVEGSGQILVSDEGHPSTTPLGLLFRVDPQTGVRTVLSDFNTGANTGSEPEGVAAEAGGLILVVDKHAGPLTRGMLFRVDPQNDAREIVSDFGAGANQGGDPLALVVVPPMHAQARLVVVTEVVNDDGGAATASAWTITVTGTNPTPTTFPGAGPPGTTVTLDAGDYAVSASGPTGYTTTLSDDCAATVAAGDSKTCTITNDDQASGPCILLSETSVNVHGAAFSTPSRRGVYGSDPHLTVTNCGTSDVNLQARGTDATGAGATWQLTDEHRDSPIDSTCEFGLDVFRADVVLWNLPNDNPGVGTPIRTEDTLLIGAGPNLDEPFVLATGAVQELSPNVETPCVGSAGAGQAMSMEVVITAIAP
jgi:sugar lactone lactonase YvrE